jgi:hypothetical protein
MLSKYFECYDEGFLQIFGLPPNGYFIAGPSPIELRAGSIEELFEVSRIGRKIIFVSEVTNQELYISHSEIRPLVAQDLL